jgi:hypothetical protein
MEFTCCLCGKKKPESEFHRRSGTKRKRKSYCKACAKKSREEWYQKNKNKVAMANKNRKADNRKLADEVRRRSGCSVPGCNEGETCCLDFHHVNEDGDRHGIADFITAWPETFRSEIEKCAILCANCHRKLHAKVIKVDLIQISLLSLGL